MEENLRRDSSETVFKNARYAQARMDCVLNIVIKKLRFPPVLAKKMIKDTWSCKFHRSGILWAKTTRTFAKDLFFRAAKLEGAANLEGFISGPARCRRKDIENVLKSLRESAPKGRFYTQIRPGRTDLEAFVKLNDGKYERKYTKIPMNIINANNDFRELRETEDDQEGGKSIAEEMEAANGSSNGNERKRVRDSPQNRNNPKKSKRTENENVIEMEEIVKNIHEYVGYSYEFES